MKKGTQPRKYLVPLEDDTWSAPDTFKARGELPRLTLRGALHFTGELRTGLAFRAHVDFGIIK
jgi:hypothetical protein